jgi:putative acetyltransferase
VVVTLRPYRPDDAPALLALFRDTIRRVNSRDYSPAQVWVWASDDIDMARWFGRFTGRFVRVAEEAGDPVGFAELEANGNVDRVYVSADYQRQEIGRRLLPPWWPRPRGPGWPGCSPRRASLPASSLRPRGSRWLPRRW